jgi:sulfur carrier protein
MTVKINVTKRRFENGSISVYELLMGEEGIPLGLVSVQLNGDILDAKLFEKTQLKDGDKVEFAYFMGGGAE